MFIKRTLFFVLVAVTALFLYAFNIRSDGEVPLPPIGKVLNPFVGLLQNGTAADDLPQSLSLAGLISEVTVKWDRRHVPHIFAENDHDLYFSQGYFTARDRLWQMEFQTHAAAGRLSEIFGTELLNYDMQTRRKGMRFGAEKTLAKMMADSLSRSMVEAYTAGVNAYISSLAVHELPLEYKLFDYAPEPWTELKCVLLLKQMAHTLSYSERDLNRDRARKGIGERKTDELFPIYPPYTEPIVPLDIQFDFDPQMPAVPATYSEIDALDKQVHRPREYNLGSNNWAVDGSKSASGQPILANDPHLHLSLPSIWYEMQLSAPGINSCGVTLPGAPGVVIGFNDSIAWGVTNGETDVTDWYRVEFQDATWSTYLHDGNWVPAEHQVEEFHVRSGASIKRTAVYTHHGPAGYLPEPDSGSPGLVGVALRWTAHDASNELRTFYLLNRAQSHSDFLDALTHFDCPTQNFLFASVAGDIAIAHNGKLPIRWTGQGRYPLDGTLSENDWSGWIPRAHLPQVKNPTLGFIGSANQAPVSEDYPYFMSGNYSSSMRARRIFQRLGAMDSITPEDMMALQMDNFSGEASLVLPHLLAALPSGELSEVELGAKDRLYSSSYESEVGESAPAIWNVWWRRFREISNQQDNPVLAELDISPRSDVIVQRVISMATGSAGQKALLADQALQSFKEAIQLLTFQSNGEPRELDEARIGTTHINHLAALPGLGRGNLPTSGGRNIVNANTTTAGPSWRMVVHLTKPIEAWGGYPGGQSGSPGSAYYDNMVDAWVAGSLEPLVFLHSQDEPHQAIVGATTLRGDN